MLGSVPRVPTLPERSSRCYVNGSTLSVAPRAELLRALTLPDFERADAIGSYWATQAHVWSEARTQCLRLTEAILSE
jgi:hypothetical protein